MNARKSTIRELRIWAVALAAPLLLLAWVSRQRPVAMPILAGLAGLLLAGAALAPRALRGPKALLDPIVERIGWLVAALALLLFCFAAVTPIGWWRRGSLRGQFGLGSRAEGGSYRRAQAGATEPMRHMDRQYA
ncbi:MAG: hypothetical protein L0323_21830 [Planctomycetes bacterium]|nr:hypothetical protein [Planctomycetota bacterium]